MEFRKSLVNSIRKENGEIALILACVFLALLGAIGGSFLYRMRLEQRAASNYQRTFAGNQLYSFFSNGKILFL